MATRTESDAVVAGLGTQQLLVVGGAVLAVVAAALPWLTVSAMGGTAPVAGYELLIEDGGSPIFNGGVTAALAVLAASLVLARDWDETTQTIALVFGVFVAFVGLVFVVALGGGTGATFVAALSDPGIGVFVTIVGGVAILAGGAMGYVGR